MMHLIGILISCTFVQQYKLFNINMP